ncbi:MAG: TolC family protein [Spirochaetota bacterium]
MTGKRTFMTLMLLGATAVSAFSQVSLEECRELALAHYPLAKRYGLIEQAQRYSLAEIAKNYLPAVILSGRSTYQSDVAPMGGLTQDQFQLGIELSQTLWDGGASRAMKQVELASTEIERKKLETDLHAFSERVDQVFFGILLLQERIKHNGILQDELRVNADRISAAIKNGVAIQSDLDAITIERIAARQRDMEMQTDLSNSRDMLSALIGSTLTPDSVLAMPDATRPDLDRVASAASSRRPELALFDAQEAFSTSQEAAVNAAVMPRFSIFLQGAYGKPGLNTLEGRDAAAYWLGGLRMNWNLGGFYVRADKLDAIAISRLEVENRREVFSFNTDLSTRQKSAEIDKYAALLAGDKELISLRTRMKQSTEARVRNGTLTESDLLQAIGALNLAEQEMILHEIQYRSAVYSLKHLINQ